LDSQNLGLGVLEENRLKKGKGLDSLGNPVAGMLGDYIPSNVDAVSRSDDSSSSDSSSISESSESQDSDNEDGHEEKCSLPSPEDTEGTTKRVIKQKISPSHVCETPRVKPDDFGRSEDDPASSVMEKLLNTDGSEKQVKGRNGAKFLIEEI